MIATHLILFSFLDGATQTPAASDSFSGAVLHATIYGFFDGYSSADVRTGTGAQILAAFTQLATGEGPIFLRGDPPLEVDGHLRQVGKMRP